MDLQIGSQEFNFPFPVGVDQNENGATVAIRKEVAVVIPEVGDGPTASHDREIRGHEANFFYRMDGSDILVHRGMENRAIGCKDLLPSSRFLSRRIDKLSAFREVTREPVDIFPIEGVLPGGEKLADRVFFRGGVWILGCQAQGDENGGSEHE